MTDSNRTMKDLIDTYLSDDAVSEFDTIVSKHRRKVIVRSSFACAASLVILVSIFHFTSHSDKHNTLPDINTFEIIQTINILADTGIDEISSITARPEGNKIIVIAEFKNGLTGTFLMKRDANDSSIELTALNGAK